MTSEIVSVPSMMKLVERSYSTPPGWRLATFQEANDKLEMIKQQGLLREWERARLLDGWISGPHYNFQMGNDFRSCLGYMLVIQIQPSGNSDHARSIYADVPLTPKLRDVALLLCVEDWNWEVVYWLLNSWENRDPLNPQDVREGNLPFSNKAKFVEMNRMICHVGKLLGEEGLAGQKVVKRQLSRDSVKEVMVSMGKSCWDKFSQEQKKILGQTFLERIERFTGHTKRQCSEGKLFQEFASNGDTSDAIWNFLWYIISSMIVADMVRSSLSLLTEELISEKCEARSRRDFIMSTAILYHLSNYVEYEGQRSLELACKDAAGDGRQCFNDTLQNPHSAYYDKTGNYDVLNKILIYVVEYGDSFMVNKLLEWGAQPQANLSPDKQNMALYYAIYYQQEEIVKSLFDKCHSKEQFANVANEERMTALHWACRENISMCEMVLGYGARQDVPDNRGRLPLHYAVERENEGIIDVLIGVDVSKHNPKRAEMVTSKDNDGVSPLDMAVKKNNIKLMVKLSSVSQQPLESHFDKVDSAKLLREYACEGNLQVVKKLLEYGAYPRACDERGRTALHSASMCEDEYKARKLTKLMLNKCTSEEEKKKWVGKKDDDDKTALHVAARKGHTRLCTKLRQINRDIMQFKDADGRSVLHDAVEGQHDNPEIIGTLLNWDTDYWESIIDHSGQTLLHVAASEGKKYITDYLLMRSRKPKVYVRTPDVLGQTALHKAAKGGHADTVTVLLHWGADPLLERDSDGRTALHCAVQNEPEDQAIAIVELLLKKCGSDEKKLLLLWASAAGLGTADQLLPDISPLKIFLMKQKENFAKTAGKEDNLLRIAACLGNTEMTKELLTRGAQIEDIKDDQWIGNLKPKEKNNVLTVCKQIQSIAEQGNDQPATSDNLGRSDFAHGLAALFLNPYLKPPITVGISGSWGMGKSSLMIQTEGILLKTAAQLALLKSEKTSSSFPGFQISEHSEKGKKRYRQIKMSIDLLLNDTNSQNKFFQIIKNKIVCWKKMDNKEPDRTTKEGGSTMKSKIEKWWRKINNKKADTNPKAGDSLFKFLNQYEAKYHHIFQSLAAIDSSGMFIAKGQESESEIDSSTEGSVPAILTVRYNAWKYRNESEALAGMAVEITRGMEGIMTDSQWLSTCLRNTWRKQKQVIWIDIIFPCLLAVLLATTFTWILWLVLDRYKIKESVELKYASFPLTVVIMVWTLVKKVMSTVNPVSVQLMNYIKLPDHTEKLGYQERVISDITFLKEEISRKPYLLCIAASKIWHCITGSCIISLLSSKYRGQILASSIPSANLRTIVFVDDLDRCQESVILQVLSAINLVLAVCEISVVLGMDKALIQRAIMKKYGDKSLKSSRRLADKYLQKIIQLPLDLPDPSEVQLKNFLDRHLGVFQKQSKEGHSESDTDAEDDSVPEIDIAYNAIFSPFQWRGPPDFKEILSSVTPIPETREPLPGTQAADAKDIAIDVAHSSETNASDPRQTGPTQTNPETAALQQTNVVEGDQSLSDLIPIRQMLFITYSKGEQNVFDYFQTMATDIRKLPREWKRLLNYHRLVWNIFLINNEAKHLDGWQVQLITWIFICWEWEENINILIENWDRLRALKDEDQDEDQDKPSLRIIVDHFIKNERWIIADDKSEKKRDTAKALENSVNKDTTPQNLEEDKKEEGVSKNKEDPESSNLEQSKLEVAKDQMIEATEPQGDVSDAGNYSETSNSVGKEKLKEVVTEEEVISEKTLKNDLDALKKEMKEQLDRIGKQQAELKEQVGSLKAEMKEQSDRIGKLQAELKEQVDSIIKQRQIWWNEKSAEEKKLKSESWGRLKFALQRYDVSMEGIQAFQRFRFYCVAGYLPWPVPERKIAEI